MSGIKIVMDSSMDIPPHLLKPYDNVYMVPMIITFGDTEYFDGETLSTEEFYRKFRAATDLPKTATPTMARVHETLSSCAQDGSSVLCLTLSSGLSGTYDLFRNVAEQLNKEHGYDITVVDSKSATLGGGLLVLHALEMARRGKSVSEIVPELEAKIRRTNHVFTVDTLEYLWKGGRLSRAEAVVGNVLDIKPILHIPDDGSIKAFHKVRGRKKALQFLVDWVGQVGTDFDRQVLAVVHWDCLKDAEEVAASLNQRYHPKGIQISTMSATIGVHTGPGLLGITFESALGRR